MCFLLRVCISALSSHKHSIIGGSFIVNISSRFNSIFFAMISALAEITSKITDSRMGNETKELLSILVTYFDGIVNQRDARVVELESRVTKLENHVAKLEESIDENNQYGRRESLIVSGELVPMEVSGEDCRNVVIDLFRINLRLNMQPNDISTAHRIGRVNSSNGSSQKRNIIIKLCRRDLAAEIYSACRQLKPKFFINDSLTPTRSKICFMLRQLKKKFPSKIKAVRSIRGEPMVTVPKEGERITRQSSANSSSTRSETRPVTITTRLQLETFVREHLKKTLQDVSLPW